MLLDWVTRLCNTVEFNEHYRNNERSSQGVCITFTALPGYGALDAGGQSIGISPALGLHEHLYRYRSPADVFNVLVYTGSGLMDREVTNIRSSDMVIIVSGRSGTLGEFAIAYDESKLIGVLQGTGGITDEIGRMASTLWKDTGARLDYSRDPADLVTRLSEIYETRHFRRPSCFCNAALIPAADSAKGRRYL